MRKECDAVGWGGGDILFGIVPLDR
jgi:hypothetical protein